ncbi:MAG: TonB-dependent receptor, partial [Saprospiraceae bacterium]|nr:TonB-dependent receptor [Saprospiraceae bacterium]
MVIVGICLCALYGAVAQCDITVSGRVVDQGTGIPLPWSNVLITEKGVGAITDSTGHFSLDGICPGAYHLRVSHVGCKTQEIFVAVRNDTTLTIALAHHLELLDEIVVHGEHGERTTMPSNTIARELISRESMQSLGDLITSVPGVRALQNGAGIAKPMIHGLFGNRVAILNNGIPQAGQQWGNDHAPEIDPFVADHISVIKGVAALEYGSEAMGGAVLVETKEISADPHLHGEVNYAFQSNGRGHALNAMLEKGGDWASWRATATMKTRGDTRTPDYFLNNTGMRESNIALQGEKKIAPAWHATVYYSLFHTQLGILRGAHIGNLIDLDEALQREVPFFTEDTFQTDIDPPRQQVIHHLLKLSARHDIRGQGILSLTYGGQLNQREEFDVRRSGRSDRPALSLDQFQHLWTANYSHDLGNGGLLKGGLLAEIEDNTNNPETGVLPLIPDYRQFDSGLFALTEKNWGTLAGEIGFRYLHRYLNVVRIAQTTPPTIERINHRFHHFAAST